MHFHLPKPLHGWREFVGEVGIIVIGVLIALSAEQVVENLHDHASARAAQENIRAEIQSDVSALASRKANEPCVTRRLDDIAAALAEPTVLKSGPVWVGHPLYATMREDQFHSAEQSGHANLLPSDEQARYSQIYAYFALYRDAQAAEIRSWADLRVLEQHPPITAVSDWQLRSALQQARTARWTMEVVADLATDAARKLGIRPRTPIFRPHQSACLSFHTPRPQALAIVIADRPGGAVWDEP